MKFRAWLSVLAIALGARAGAETIKVVASTPDLAFLAKVIGGEQVEADSIIKGNRDVHAVELLPSLMMKVRKADIYIKVGMDLDLWAQQIIDGSRNAKLVILDASEKIEKLHVPTFKVDASYGDLHLYGNPHYWLDPVNVRPIGEVIVDGLARIAPDQQAQFHKNLEEYIQKMDEHIKVWQEKLSPYAHAKIISYHDSWPYFAQRFDLEVVEFLEPKPGIPPTPTHIAKLQELLKSGQVKAILLESYFDDRVPKMLERTTGVPVVKVPILVGALPEVQDQFALFDMIVAGLVEAFGKAQPS